MCPAEVFGPRLEIGVVRVQGKKAMKPHLQANELRPVSIAVLVEPVGINEPRGVVVGRIEDGAEKGRVGGGVEHQWYSTTANNPLASTRRLRGADRRPA